MSPSVIAQVATLWQILASLAASARDIRRTVKRCEVREDVEGLLSALDRLMLVARDLRRDATSIKAAVKAAHNDIRLISKRAGHK